MKCMLILIYMASYPCKTPIHLRRLFPRLIIITVIEAEVLYAIHHEYAQRARRPRPLNPSFIPQRPERYKRPPSRRRNHGS